MNKAKLWEGLSEKAPDGLLEEFNNSFCFDFRLWKADIAGSLAHAEMLQKTSLITEKDWLEIQTGLREIAQEINKDENAWLVQNKDSEDIHSAIESVLTAKIGEAGRRLHTARSRNDQVATDLRLWLREENYGIGALLLDLRQTFCDLAERDKNILMPGYTHLQKAQPISLGHHWMAHYERFSRDFDRLIDINKRLNICPLGAGALAGTTYPIDREFTAKKLGFDRPSNNSLDSVSDRDFVAEYLFLCSLCGIHLSQVSEELINWSSQEWGFITLDSAFATGSSMMPQKKNPDIPELIRGKTGRLLGNLISMLSVLKALPLAYNKDLQEDKEALFDSCDTIKISLRIINLFLKSIEINDEIMCKKASTGFLNATDLADSFVKNGLAFRDAYKAVGKLVRKGIETGKELQDLDEISPEIISQIKPEICMQNRKSFGGTSPERVFEQILCAKEILQKQKNNIQGDKSFDLNKFLFSCKK